MTAPYRRVAVACFVGAFATGVSADVTDSWTRNLAYGLPFGVFVGLGVWAALTATAEWVSGRGVR